MCQGSVTSMYSEQGGDSMGRRLILGARQAGISAAGRVLHERLACLMCSRVLGCLAAVMSRAKLLAPREQACPHHCPAECSCLLLMWLLVMLIPVGRMDPPAQKGLLVQGLLQVSKAAVCAGECSWCALEHCSVCGTERLQAAHAGRWRTPRCPKGAVGAGSGTPFTYCLQAYTIILCTGWAAWLKPDDWYPDTSYSNCEKGPHKGQEGFMLSRQRT